MQKWCLNVDVIEADNSSSSSNNNINNSYIATPLQVVSLLRDPASCNLKAKRRQAKEQQEEEEAACKQRRTETTSTPTVVWSLGRKIHDPRGRTVVEFVIRRPLSLIHAGK